MLYCPLVDELLLRLMYWGMINYKSLSYYILRPQILSYKRVNYANVTHLKEVSWILIECQGESVCGPT